ncbi:hypothetical protein C447_00700 [Halococcus hamelinensis 100A6]|uniref:Uncharacterized protein n=1 Tax=Halococcus hamelinensis 100A6 TaxID=1132509 RepID=M0MBR2_9EURY|nr:hypothetical protein C447_00700 [Halococcus hamelinensis 100A6]
MYIYSLYSSIKQEDVGKLVVTEKQQIGIVVRFDEQNEERTISADVHTMVIADGLNDVIGEFEAELLFSSS